MVFLARYLLREIFRGNHGKGKPGRLETHPLYVHKFGDVFLAALLSCILDTCYQLGALFPLIISSSGHFVDNLRNPSLPPLKYKTAYLWAFLVLIAVADGYAKGQGKAKNRQFVYPSF